jgi:hypothetical protein
VALSRCHEHEGSQEKVLGKVRAVGSHRASRATTGRQSRAARRCLNGSGAPVAPQGSEVVLQLRVGGRGGEALTYLMKKGTRVGVHRNWAVVVTPLRIPVRRSGFGHR